jgi:hypothetical protein
MLVLKTQKAVAFAEVNPAINQQSEDDRKVREANDQNNSTNLVEECFKETLAIATLKHLRALVTQALIAAPVKHTSAISIQALIACPKVMAEPSPVTTSVLLRATC